ncbi:hypothetical protein [Actinokineospora iranica]|uniref:hypothetical protein n=1 Tax=Actinokineospora iranica TaxID=1271860 RepID=UPI00111373EB|nr:hypothetical protein [Actinokineospora iranica]
MEHDNLAHLLRNVRTGDDARAVEAEAGLAEGWLAPWLAGRAALRGLARPTSGQMTRLAAALGVPAIDVVFAMVSAFHTANPQPIDPEGRVGAFLRNVAEGRITDVRSNAKNMLVVAVLDIWTDLRVLHPNVPRISAILPSEHRCPTMVGTTLHLGPGDYARTPETVLATLLHAAAHAFLAGGDTHDRWFNETAGHFGLGPPQHDFAASWDQWTPQPSALDSYRAHLDNLRRLISLAHST